MLILASLVLATPACSVTQDDVTQASEEALSARVSLKAKSFLSTKIFTVSRFTVGPGQVDREVKVQYRLTFVPAVLQKEGEYIDRAYTFEDAQPGETMEYEVIIETVEVGHPENKWGDDITSYAKRTGRGAFRLYDCDTTRRCQALDSSVGLLTVGLKNGVETIRLSNLHTEDRSATDTGFYLLENRQDEQPELDFVLTSKR